MSGAAGGGPAPAPALPGIADIRKAADRIRGHVHRTPVLTCASIDALLGCRVFFKCENLQKTGAFKARGACNAVLSLSDAQAARGVATHSSGNHAAALARAARLRGLGALIVMPEDASRTKRAAVEHYGARIVLCAPGIASRERALAAEVERCGASVVHPYDDPRVIAGQGTAALELLEEVPDLEVLIAPVGGGGLLAGTAVTAAALAPALRVLGAEPAAADDACRSLAAGRVLMPDGTATIADGLRSSLGSLGFAAMQRHVPAVLCVSEAGIVRAMRLVWERMKLVIEPSAAVALGAMLENDAGLHGRRVGVILSGGNLDLDALPWSGSG